MRFVDARGRRLDVIVLDRGHGPEQLIRVTWFGFLLGEGYYRTSEEALKLVDAASVVEVIELRP